MNSGFDEKLDSMSNVFLNLTEHIFCFSVSFFYLNECEKYNLKKILIFQSQRPFRQFIVFSFYHIPVQTVCGFSLGLAFVPDVT